MIKKLVTCFYASSQANEDGLEKKMVQKVEDGFEKG